MIHRTYQMCSKSMASLHDAHLAARMRGILERRCSLKKTSIGGQAVMEGVMMKNLDRYAVAVRKPDHEIEVMTDEYKSLGSRYAVLGLPIIRGVVNLSLIHI